MKKTKLTKALAGLLLGAMIASVWPATPVFAARNPGQSGNSGKPTHGTSAEWITEDMLNNTPPADYVVNDATQGKAEDALYNAYFLKDKVQTVSIEIDENNLNYLLQNAVDEPYVMADSVTIGDTKVQYCGFKTKGAYTLLHSYTDNPNSDRFSFTVNFGKYIKKKDYGQKQDFYGCNKISFNNFFFDKSMMKEFCALMLMEEMGLPTPQFGIAKLYINDKYYGVYAMVEAFDESILEQYYGVDDDDLSSYLTKPENTNFIYEELLEDDSPLWEEDEDTYADVEDMLPTVMDWVKKLNLLSEGKDFEGNKIDVNSDEYVELLGQIYDLDEVLKYFAAHSWLCQIDNMFDGQKNFGLYVDQAGKAMIMPWDYDLSFGCYYPTSGEWTANFNIDAMYKLANWGQDIRNRRVPDDAYEDFPLFNVIFQNKELMERYYGYMKDCSKIAALGGTVEWSGKTYEAGYIESYITGMEDSLMEAASEKLGDNVYYMNGSFQPYNMEDALPNLANIIAMRALGVYVQVENINTYVSANGCDLGTLGNANMGFFENTGTLSSIDSATGIYITANYQGGRRDSAPLLTVKEIDEKHEFYKDIKTAVGYEEGDTLIIYNMKDMGKVVSDYQISIPVSQEMLDAGGDIQFYEYDNGAKKISMELNDNRYSGEVDTITFIAVLQKGTTVAEVLIPILIGVAAVVVVLVIVLIIVKKSKKKQKAVTNAQVTETATNGADDVAENLETTDSNETVGTSEETVGTSEETVAADDTVDIQ